MNWLQYLLEANLYLAIFYLVYCLFLNKETYYLFNRAYLLFSCVISFILPLVQLGFLRPREQNAQVVSYVIAAHGLNNYVKTEVANSYFTLQNCLLSVYLLGTVIFVILLIIKLNHLFSLTRNKSVDIKNQYKLVHINDSNSAFSFFNYLFIGTKAMDAEIIIRHELVHIRQKHSVDIILLELIKVINWFNPVIYLLQNSLKTLHEYIADEQTASCKTDPLTYSAFLVNNAYGIGGPSITHSFFNYNLLKKRIIMLNQKRSGSLARLKYLVTVPVCAGLLCVSTLGFSKTYGWEVFSPKISPADIAAQKVKTLKSTEGEVVGYGDKITIHGKMYTANNLTDADKAYLLKTYKIKLEVVEIKGKPGQATMFFPSTSAKDTNNNSITTTSTYTSKGYKFKEEGYLINGKSNFRVVITEKNGREKAYFKNSATPAQVKLLKDKYGYTFPTMPIYPKLPPPPPLPPTGKPVKPIPPVKAYVTIADPVGPVKPKSALPPKGKPEKPVPPVNAEVTIDEPVSPQQVKSPPPPPQSPFDSLYKYIARNVRYPQSARMNHVAGKVIINFNIIDGKIQDVTMPRGLFADIDAEAMRVMNNYKAPLNVKSANYSIAISFALIDAGGKYVGRAPKTNNTVTGAQTKMAPHDQSYMLNEVVVVSYI